MTTDQPHGHPVSSPARWVLSPMDGQAHLLLPVGDHPWDVLNARCGHLMPVGPSQHEQPPSGVSACPTCALISQVPAPQFPHKTPAGHRSSAPVPAPGGQPDPTVCPTPASAAAVPRWARCPVDQQPHLLDPAGVREVVALGSAQSLCGRLIFAQGLTLTGRCGAPCVSCLAAGTA
jgi:hypothetical protein